MLLKQTVSPWVSEAITRPKSPLLVGDRRHRAIRNSDTRENGGGGSV